MIFTDSHQLAVTIQTHYHGNAIIGVDGWTGVGKTTLANALATATGGAVFDLDTALDRDRGCYVHALRKDDIRSALSVGGLLFVAGICLRQVLDSVEVCADASVYVKRMALSGWADEDELSGRIPEFAGASGANLRQELRDYHANWRPHLESTYEFHRPG